MNRARVVSGIAILLWVLGGCSQKPLDTVMSQSGSVKVGVSAELNDAVISLAPQQDSTALATRTVEQGDSVIEFNNIEPGTYVVYVTMSDGRTFSAPVEIGPGESYDLGVIRKIDTTDMADSGPIQVVNYPEFIAWHYPAPNERVVFGNYYYERTGSADPSGAASTDIAVEPARMRLLSISFQFAKPMDRQSMEEAFSVLPAADGFFSWNYVAPYWHTDGTEPYVLQTGTMALTEAGMVKAGIGSSDPMILPVPVLKDTNLVYGFTFSILESSVLLDTAYQVTIASTAKDSSGVAIGEDYRFSFFVVSAPSPYPYIAITPAIPVSTQNTVLQLVLGISQSACDPTYTASFTRTGNDIRLAYQEIQTDMACIMIAVAPHPYGPTFDLGKLAAGDYRVFTVDSQFVGAFSVSQPAMVGGTVLQMEDPSIVHIRAPVLSGVVITAENSGGYWYMPAPDLSAPVTDTSDANGRFSLELSPTNGSYKITAQKDGYYPQVLFWNSYIWGAPVLANGAVVDTGAAPALVFELIDTASKPLGNLAVTVKCNGAAVESAYVCLSAGDMYGVRPMPAMEMATRSSSGAADAMAPSQDLGVSSLYWGYTNADGKLTLGNVSLTPYIEFTYSVSGRTGGYATGTVRLSAFVTKTLSVELSEPAIVPADSVKVYPDSTVVYPQPLPAERQ